jgi:predicted lipoprotein with Yx(FWY)xxD motif
MKRVQRIVLATALTAAAVGAGAIASAQGGEPRAHATSTAKVELRHTRIGSILTTSSGLTLYEFTRDRRDEDSCAKVHGCLSAWPALETSGQPSAGPGVKGSLLSSIRLSNGAKQVVYDGHALYTYAGDTAGDTSYVGASSFGGSWYAVSATGGTVK